MKKVSYTLNVVLFAALAFIAYKFVYDGNVATNSEDRIAVVVTAAEKARELGEMRSLLETTQGIILAVTSDDIASIPELVAPLGMVATQKESVTFMAKLPLGLKTMGFDAHGSMDTLGEMAENGASGNEILTALGNAMSLCVACHQTYRFVAEEEINQ